MYRSTFLLLYICIGLSGSLVFLIYHLLIGFPSNVDIKCSNLNIIVKGQFGTLENTIPKVLQLHKQNAFSQKSPL